MVKKVLLALVFVVLVVGSLVYAKIGQFTAMGEAGANMAMPPETITASPAQAMQWEQIIDGTGTLTAVQGVTVSAEAAGRVSRIAFEPGQRVEAGAVLIELDTASEDAQLAAAEASAALARATLKRRQELANQKLVSPADLETAASQAKEAQSQVGIARAMIAKKTMRAPFTGRLGLRQVNLGQILSVGDPVVSLQSVGPINVDFSVPQQQLAVLRVGMKLRLTSDAEPGTTFEGHVTVISPEVDPITRSVRVQGQVDNPDDKLLAGMYVQVKAVRSESRSVLAIPGTSISFATFGDSVFVVEEKKNEKSGETERVLAQRFVRLGERRGDFVAVTEGLAAGDQVATSGVFKLRSGMQVVIDNKLAPKPSLTPDPPQS